MVNAIVAALVVVPVVPVTFTAYVPGAAVAAALKVSVTGLLGAVTGQLNPAVTPAGTPDKLRFTLLLLSPTRFATPMVLATLLPPIDRETALADDVTLKLGTGTVKEMFVELLRVPAVPLTVTM